MSATARSGALYAIATCMILSLVLQALTGEAAVMEQEAPKLAAMATDLTQKLQAEEEASPMQIQAATDIAMLSLEMIEYHRCERDCWKTLQCHLKGRLPAWADTF